MAILDFEKSIRYDVELMRNSPAVAKHVKIYGFFYEINGGVLTEIVQDIPSKERRRESPSAGDQSKSPGFRSLAGMKSRLAGTHCGHRSIGK